MGGVFIEGNLCFDFSACGKAARFDDAHQNAQGMKSVDFVAETDDVLYFLEVKDYQHPGAPRQRQKADLLKLLKAARGEKTIFALEMGGKIKDSLLRCYAGGETFCKQVIYLLLIHLDGLGEFERGLLKVRINGHVPLGLNHPRFTAFGNIKFDLVNAAQLAQYGIVCRAADGGGVTHE